MKLTSGVEKLDEILKGGIESKSSILLLADTMVDKASFAQHILSHRLQKGDTAIYLTTSKSPSGIIENMYDHGWKTKPLIFVDCISSTLNKKSKTKYTLKAKIISGDISVLEETIELLMKAIKSTKGSKIVVFDALETFMNFGVNNVFKQMRKLNKILKECNTTIIYLLTNWNYASNELNEITNTINLTIKLATTVKKMIWTNYFQVNASPKIFFQITLTGVNLYVPKILVTGPFQAGKSSVVRALSERAISVDRLGTTVALDHGHLEKKGLVCDIFGTPGQERFDWILKILAKDTWGIILVVDSTQPLTFDRAIEMLEKIRTYEIPFVVFANKQDLPMALKPKEVGKKLGLPYVVGTSAKTKKGCEEGFKLLLDRIFKGI